MLARYEFAAPHMGTEFRILLYAPNERRAERAAAAAFRRVAELDEMMSDYRSSSELMRLCERAGDGWIAISPELFYVLARAQAVAARTGGAFDVTAAPLVRLWRRARRRGELPSSERVAEARALTGYRLLRLDAKRRRARLVKPGMRLDLGGIAKGYAADEALATLRRHEITRALVAASGDIRAGDAPPDAAGWRVGVAGLDGANAPPLETLLLRNAAVSTSGDAAQSVTIGGVRYSHILDPRTGVGLRDRRSVTVVARDGITSDALDTAASVIGMREGLRLIEETPGAAALFVEGSTDGEPREARSNLWRRLPRTNYATKLNAAPPVRRHDLD